jgi:hypothetical protein
MSNFKSSLETALQQPLPSAGLSTRLFQQRVQGFDPGVASVAPYDYFTALGHEHALRKERAYHDFLSHPWNDALSEHLVPATFRRVLFAQNPLELVSESINKVEAHYIITEGKERVAGLFCEQRELPKLLLEAVRPLRTSFGEKLLQLQANSDGDDIFLKSTILWPGDAASARAALDNFDQSWWLDNCTRAHGHLIFDYELVDGL